MCVCVCYVDELSLTREDRRVYANLFVLSQPEKGLVLKGNIRG